MTDQEGQGSLFDARGLQPNVVSTSGRAYGKVHLTKIAAASMVEPGYYLIAGVRVYLDIYRRMHKFKTWNERLGRWLDAMYLLETDEPFVFQFTMVGGNPDAVTVFEFMLELATHPTKYRREYSREFDRCSECNRKLSNDKSRHYALGSECITKRPELVNQIDAENDGLSWEALNARSKG